EEYYQILFDKAFLSTDQRPVEDKILEAISAFVNSIASFNSKFDRSLMNQANLSPGETRGHALYIQHCSSCHGNMMRQSLSLANNGLDVEYADQGVGKRTGKAEDMGVFKIPMLRNIELTAPYMHDGRFQTLEQVIEHYSEQVQPHPNLHPNLRNPDGTPKRLHLSASEKADLVAFLKTLTDLNSLTAEKYADPFK
ncbi:MAG: cytochrome-c peroxidase, partial [Bacteroidetes bacterium]